ncbi:HNH endonuclease [Natrialbaceae archaeon GCM10025896]
MLIHLKPRARTPEGRLRVLIGASLNYLTHLPLLYPLARGRLYIRQSPIATATRLLPGGTTPKKADISADVPPYPEDWGTIATLVRQRDGHQCRNCGAVGGPRDGNAELHVDHQVPRSQGGPDDPINLRTLCRGCHEARHGRRFEVRVYSEDSTAGTA